VCKRKENVTAIQVVANFISHASNLGMYVSDYFKEDTKKRERVAERKERNKTFSPSPWVMKVWRIL
jgi:hypothetical protein